MVNFSLYYYNNKGEIYCRTPEEFDNPYDKEIQQLHTNTLLKHRGWLNTPEINEMKKVMEPFLNQHLSKIQEVAIQRMETIHFSKNCNNRPVHLAHLSDLQNKYSLRVTENGDVWILFLLKNKKNDLSEGPINLAYSPTLVRLGVKKTGSPSEIYGNLLANSYNSSVIVPILDISKIWGKTYGHQDKYSMITPKFDGSIDNLIKSLMIEGSLNSLLQVFDLQKSAVRSWINLIRETGIFHPDMNFGNIVYSYDNKNLITKFIDFDELDQSCCLSKDTLDNMENFYVTETQYKNYIYNIFCELIEYLIFNVEYLNESNITFSIENKHCIQHYFLYLLASLRGEGEGVASMNFESLNQKYGADLDKIIFNLQNVGNFYSNLDFIFEQPLGEILRRMETFATLPAY